MYTYVCMKLHTVYLCA